MGRTLLAALVNAVKGVAIGAANTVPGVSGGTIAVVTGIYDRLVAAIGNIISRQWREHLLFLVPVLAGIFLGIALFAQVIDFGLTNYEEQTYFVFVGLIAGSLPFLVNQVRGERPKVYHVIAGIAAFGALAAQAFLSRPGLTPPITEVTLLNAIPLVLTGMVATGTMIIPGVSGSFVLLLIGMYSTFLQSVRAGNFAVLGVLAVGAVIGLVAISKVMDLLLTRARTLTYWIILGLVTGSILVIFPGVSSWLAALADLVAFVIGAALALLLGRKPRAGDL